MEARKISKEDGVTLTHLSDLAHQFYHRNKNQHRRSVWWRQFQIFRKQLHLVSIQVKALHEVPSTHLARIKKKVDDEHVKLQIEQSISFWQDTMVPKWQHAFSQLSADGRFAVLGLVLLATLAQACRIVNVTAAFEDMGQAEVEKVLMQFANEDWERPESDGVLKARGEDMGEAINRDSTEDAHHSGSDTKKTQARSMPVSSPPSALEPSPSGVKRAAARTERTSSKKRRKGNAIDDLFGGLG